MSMTLHGCNAELLYHIYLQTRENIPNAVNQCFAAGSFGSNCCHACLEGIHELSPDREQGWFGSKAHNMRVGFAQNAD
jgi:CII-binding regulator of phage lambda lysogenization HflD